MDGCDVEKAVVFGMPCCKKWCFYRPEQPLYYQDDNGPCYVYAYADQMVADAWLALDDKDRARFAPCFASFDPTDLAAIAHVKRMYQKYPKMWRGIGEVMCRHDDLTDDAAEQGDPAHQPPGARTPSTSSHRAGPAHASSTTMRIASATTTAAGRTCTRSRRC